MHAQLLHWFDRTAITDRGVWWETRWTWDLIPSFHLFNLLYFILSRCETKHWHLILIQNWSAALPIGSSFNIPNSVLSIQSFWFGVGGLFSSGRVIISGFIFIPILVKKLKEIIVLINHSSSPLNFWLVLLNSHLQILLWELLLCDLGSMIEIVLTVPTQYSLCSLFALLLLQFLHITHWTLGFELIELLDFTLLILYFFVNICWLTKYISSHVAYQFTTAASICSQSWFTDCSSNLCLSRITLRLLTGFWLFWIWRELLLKLEWIRARGFCIIQNGI